MKKKSMLVIGAVGFAVFSMSAMADITVARASTDFTSAISQIEGDVDPVTLASFDAHGTYGSPTSAVNGDGTVSITTPSDNYPIWNLAVANNYLDSATGWTWESRFRIDSANESDKGVFEIFLRDNDNGLAATRIHFHAGGLSRDNYDNGVTPEIAADLTDGFHIVRGAVEAGTNLTTVWLDGSLVIDAQVSNNYDAGEFGLIGRWGGQTAGGEATIDYIRFDTTGAFSPIPEPATLGLVAVFGGGILFIRRTLTF